jgi:PAS domain S-box-containing protein
MAILAFAILGVIIFLFVLYRSLNYGFSPSILVQSTAILAFFVMSQVRKKIRLEIKVWVVLFLTSVVFITGLYNYGFFASGKVYILLISVIMSFVLRRKQLYYAIGGFMLIYLTFAYCYTHGILKINFDANVYGIRKQIWAMDFFIIFASSIVLLIISRLFISNIYQTYETILKKNTDLEDRELRYRTLFETSNDAIAIIKDAVFFDCNAKTFELFNCAPSYILGKHPFELSPEFQSDGISSAQKAEKILHSVAQGNPEIFEWQHLRPSGEIIDVQVSLNVIKLERAQYIQVVLRDITIDKLNKKELENYRKNLEMVVHTRTEELEAMNEELKAYVDELYQHREVLETTVAKLKQTQKQLIETEKMASIGVLTAGVAHEINNPLNYIQGGIYSLESIINYPARFPNESKRQETEKFVLDNMQVGVSRIANIVKSLNHFSRTDYELNAPCNIHLILENCLQILHHEFENKTEIFRNYWPSELVVSGNDGKLHQVFMNLLSNANQAINAKGKITINTQFIEINKCIQIEIADNGTGISTENLPKIFDPFFTTKEAGKGTGLGLSIVYRIITDHNGKINIKSKQNIGTSVIIQIPLNQFAYDTP